MGNKLENVTDNWIYTKKRVTVNQMDFRIFRDFGSFIYFLFLDA